VVFFVIDIAVKLENYTTVTFDPAEAALSQMGHPRLYTSSAGNPENVYSVTGTI
jgi:hypothetical protein